MKMATTQPLKTRTITKANVSSILVGESADIPVIDFCHEIATTQTREANANVAPVQHVQAP